MERPAPFPTARALAALVCCCLASAASAQVGTVTPAQAASPTGAAGKAAPAPQAQRRGSAFRQVKLTGKAKSYYLARWGVDRLKVSSTASGNLIRFSYRVAEPERAKVLGDKRFTPYMVSPRHGAVLQVPVMDKVGPLRQAMPPEAGKEYWMVFSNKGNFVRPGDRVDVLIGSFHADGLMVD